MRGTTPSTKLAVSMALGVLAVAVAAQTGSAADKVQICHGTASDSNPYVLITVSANAQDTHLVGQDGTAPGHGRQNAPDFVYKPQYLTCDVQFAAGDTGGTE